MKLKQQLKSKDKMDKSVENQLMEERNRLNKIDVMNSVLTGDDFDLDADGVALSVEGSDIEGDFSDDERTNGRELGEYSSDDSDVEHQTPVRKSVASKVVNAGKTAATVTPSEGRSDRLLGKFSHLKNDPEFKQFLEHMLDNRMAARGEIGSGEKLKRNKSKDKSSKDIEKIDGEVYDSLRTEQARLHLSTVKSPSDTTIYSPRLCKVTVNHDGNGNDTDSTLIDKISNFVEGIRLDAENKRSCDVEKSTPRVDVRKVMHNDSTRNDSSRGRRERSKSPTPNPDRIADQLLVQAERFKAKVEAPKGNFLNDILMPYDHDKLRDKFVKPEGLAPLDNKILFLRNFDQDDEFFHITSQIDSGLKQKIERGEFVELERLLPKDRSVNRTAGDELNRHLFQLITQGTNRYVEPPMQQRGGKINNIRKWDQAFRVYAAIYTHANPQRALEIWQYVYVIHTAASTNHWDNVYYYNINFHELMASKPWWSWGKTYTQGWNMAFNNSSVANSNYNTNSNSSSAGTSFNKPRDWKDDCCWRYNKNRCKRTANECNYDHRCTYCAGWNHGFHNCRKRQNRNR